MASKSDGTILWKTQYFSKKYIPLLETDMQQVFPVDFSIVGDTIVVKHERYDDHHGVYMLDKKTGKIIQ